MCQISNEKKLIVGLEDYYSSSLTTIKETSCNTTANRDFVEIDFQVLHVDKINPLLTDGCEISNCLSVDTIIFNESKNTLYLIEFKEQWPHRDQNHKIRLKFYDTLSKLCLFWINKLNGSKEDFFNLKFKYCLITRGKLKKQEYHSSFLTALNLSSQCFKLKLLETSFVEETKILITPMQIYSFLSNATQKINMIYHNDDGSKIHFP